MEGWRWLVDVSLVSGPLHWAIVVVALGSLAGLLALHRTRQWVTRSLPIAFALATLLVALVWLWLELAKPWPDALPLTVWTWIFAAMLAVVLAVLGGRRRRWRVRGLAAVAAVCVVAGTTDGIDTVYGSFPTVATALQLPPPNKTSVDELREPVAPRTSHPPEPVTVRNWRPPPDMPTQGSVSEVTFPGTRSGFQARPGWVYVPPAYFTPRPPPLPLLFLVGGQPGSPRDWLNGASLSQRLDAWAAEHAGLAPVVVMPDALGSQWSNPLCIDSARGRSDTYLSQDVIDWVTSSLRVDPDHRHWAVGGYSFGGTCALQLAVAHPDLFPTFYDVSGQRSPDLGSHNRTVAAAFSGDEAAFAKVDPLRQLAARSYAGSAGFIAAGAQDPEYRTQAQEVAAAAQKAGMAVTYREFPGRHDWGVWAPAFADALPWLMDRMGLTR